MTTKNEAKANNKPRTKSLLKAMAMVEKVRQEIAKATGDGDMQIDVEHLGRLAKKAEKDIANQMNIPVEMVKVTADIVFEPSKKEAA